MEERIKYLFRQYLNNQCSRSEFDEFFQYMRNASHDETIRALIKTAYEESGQTSFTYVDEAGNLVLPEPERFQKPVVAHRGRAKKLMAITILAACLILVMGTWLFNQFNSGRSVHPVEKVLTKKETDRSEYKFILLPDSTQVWLNAASTLQFPSEFEGNNREVFLSGEAYFDVKHLNNKPFIIHTGKVSTTVLGTAFNIKAYPGLKNIVVAVSRGKVRVDYEQKELAILTPGQQVRVSNTSDSVARKKMDVNEVAAWQQGNLVFEDESIQDILSDLERIYNATIVVRKPALERLMISTSFKREVGIEQALQILCRLTDAELKQENGTYIIQ